VKKISLLLALICCLASTLKAQPSNSLTLSEKFYGLSSFWSEANYNFVYMYKVDQVAWHAAYKQAIANIQTAPDDYAYYRELQKLCALLKDGHTQVYMPDSLQNLVMTTHFGPYRLFLSHINGKVYVTNVNKSKENEIPLGSEIVKVNGLATADYRDRYVASYISSSTAQDLVVRASYNLLSGLAGAQYDLEIKTPSGQSKQFHLSHSNTKELELSSMGTPHAGLFEFKWLPDSTAYVALRSFNDATVVEEFEAALPQLSTAKRVVVDIRNNGGGSSKHAANIAKYFVQGDSIYGARNYSREIIPTERAIGSFLSAQDTVDGKAQWGLSKQEATTLFKAYSGAKFHTLPYSPMAIQTRVKLRQPTAVLTNVHTASAAEDFLIYLYAQAHVVRVGDFTNGSTGQPLQLSLPGNGSAWICTKKVTLPSGEEFVGYGIKPHKHAPQQLEDVLHPNISDTQLEAALQYLAEKEI